MNISTRVSLGPPSGGRNTKARLGPSMCGADRLGKRQPRSARGSSRLATQPRSHMRHGARGWRRPAAPQPQCSLAARGTLHARDDSARRLWERSFSVLPVRSTEGCSGDDPAGLLSSPSTSHASKVVRANPHRQHPTPCMAVLGDSALQERHGVPQPLAFAAAWARCLWRRMLLNEVAEGAGGARAAAGGGAHEGARPAAAAAVAHRAN